MQIGIIGYKWFTYKSPRNRNGFEDKGHSVKILGFPKKREEKENPYLKIDLIQS